MFKKTNHNEIEFICEYPSLDFILKPEPASKHLPEWYKNMHSYIGGKKVYNNGTVNETIKKCMPVFDMATSGYFIVTPSDIRIDFIEETQSFSFTWPAEIESKLVTEHSLDQANTFRFPEGYSKNFFKWTNHWIVKTPKGWSAMFIQPSHRDDLPFQILPGLVDTDEFKLSVQFPFILREKFSGVIPAGTPIAQVIPIKRSDWSSKYSVLPEGQRAKDIAEHSIFFSNRYKDKTWKKKTYK